MTQEKPRLDGRVALVTGASKGIGRAVAQRLASLGADVAVSASGRFPDELEETRRLVAAAGVRAAALPVDLLDLAARSRLVDEAAARLGPVDILVNNAGGITSYAPVGEMSLKARLRTFELNLHAPLSLIQAALPAMRGRGWGRIVNISSASARVSRPPYVPVRTTYAINTYGAAKAALNRLTEGLAAELSGTGIHVNAVAPSAVAASENAMDVARAVAAAHPEWVESVDMMSEATAILIAQPFTGIVAYSRDVLAMTEAPLVSVDGRRVIGTADSFPEIG